MKRVKVALRWDRRRSRDGSSYALLRWTDPITGERQQEVLGFVSDEDGEHARVRKEAQILLGIHTSAPTSPPGGWTVDDAIVLYLKELPHRGSKEHQTRELRRCQYLGRHLGRAPLDKLSASHLQRYLATRKSEKTRRKQPPSRATLFGEISALKRAFRCARDQGYTDREPPKIPPKVLPDDARPPRRLTEAEVRKLVEAGLAYESRFHGPAPWVGRIIQLLAWCPRRPIAIYSIQRQDCERLLDKKLPRAKVQLYCRRDKGGIGRGWTPLTDPALEALRAQLKATPGKPSDLLWTNFSGDPLKSGNMSRIFERIARDAGVKDVTIYDLRKFGASRIYALCGNLRVVQTFTGHAQPDVLLRNYITAEQGVAEELASRVSWTSKKK